MLIRNYLDIKNKIEIGKYSFLIGVFFLPTALPIAGIFLIIGLVQSLLKDKIIIFNDKINFSIIIAIFLMVISTVINFTYLLPREIEDSSNTFLWLNLFNWIPTLLCFIVFQNYLRTSKDRLKFAQFFIAGTIPLLGSCIFQLFFNINGPFQILNGLIVWFQKPIYASGGFSGLFSNPNYAGIWLAISFPFSLFLLKNTKNNLNKKLLVLIFCISIPIMIYFTSSRNAFLGILIAFITLFGFTKFVFSIFLIVLTFLFSFLTSFLTNNQIILNNFLNLELVDKFLNIDYFSAPRIEIWQSALSRINERPLFGWGPSTFSYLHHEKNYHSLISEKIVEAYHSHNMIIELAHNFGIPLSIILASSISFLILKAWHKIFIKVKKEDESFLDKAWFSASLIVVFSHLIDVTYYDGKISILICILFAGLRCIINEKYNNVKFTYLKKS